MFASNRGRTIVVVFTDENDGQIPKSRHVESLKDLPLVCRAISVPALETFFTRFANLVHQRHM